MARLPVPGSDGGTWGELLNEFLDVEHNTDGTLKRGADITNALNTANSAQTAVTGKIDKSTATTKGDLLVASAASTIARLGVGLNGQMLTADSTQTLGVKWSDGAFLRASDFGAKFDGTTNDAAAIQAAINAAISTGKPLLLDPGTAIIGTSLSINAALTIVGAGRASTTLKAANGLNDYVITFTGGPNGVGIIGAHLSDFTIDGNSANQTAGGGIKANGAVQCTFERLHLTSCYDWGLIYGPITGGAFGHHNRTINCLFDNAGTSAGYGGGATTTSSDENWFILCDFEFLGGASNPVDNNPVMLYDQAGLEYIVNCNFVSGYNNCIGVRIQNTKATKIVGCVFDGVAGDAVYIAAVNCLVSNNVFTGTGDNGSGGVSSVHTQYGVVNTIISSNIFESSANVANLRSHIREEQIGNSGPNIIEGNTFSTITFAPTVAAVESAGNGTMVRNNLGWTTDNFGTATVANATTSIAVNHGLNITPTIGNISVTPTNSLGTATKFWVSNPTNTQFTINVNADPGATTATFAWSIKN
jgi:hypothetical protein